MSPPTTFRGESGGHAETDWNAYSSLHRRDDGGGLLHHFKSIRSGTLKELVRHVMSLPPEDRRGYVIEKAGDHRLDYQEIAALASRPDFPKV